ncbi:MAG: AbrB/MazE/SpoVT family DNA-binding domain-containing protein [Thiotrichaceae bacterium]
MTPPTQIVLQLNTQGQLIIPMDLRVILNLKEDDVVCAYLENNRLILKNKQILNKNSRIVLQG